MNKGISKIDIGKYLENEESVKMPYRVMSEVLPTDWSPKSTIFVLLSGDDVKSAV
jgi:hypothetical protein